MFRSFKFGLGVFGFELVRFLFLRMIQMPKTSTGICVSIKLPGRFVGGFLRHSVARPIPGAMDYGPLFFGH